MKQLIAYWPFATLFFSAILLFLFGVLKKKFIPATDIKSAIEVAKRLEEDGFIPIINFLGERYTNKNQIEQTVDAYVFLVDAIRKNNLKAKISVKPTQIGLAISEELYWRNILRLIRRAHNQKVPLEIDMENLSYLKDTLGAFSRISGYFNVRQAIQSYLRRSKDDINEMIKQVKRIRLVKGAYGVSDLSPQERKDQFFALAEKLILTGYNPAVATVRDKKLIKFIRSMRKKYSWSVKRLQQFSIQTLYGCADRLKYNLYGDGFRIEVYVPVGHWHRALPYIWRRIKEIFKS